MAVRSSFEIPWHLIIFTSLALLLGGPLAGATAIDITGEWTAQTLMGPSGSETPVPTTFTFEVKGHELSGTVDTPRGMFEISDGAIEDDSLTFSVIVADKNSRVKMLYDGRITADGIDFISKIESGDRSDHFLAKRVPAQ